MEPVRSTKALRSSALLLVLTIALITTLIPSQSGSAATKKRLTTTKKRVTSSPQTTVAPTTQAPVTAPPATTIARGGVLVAAIAADPGQLNPAVTTSGGVHAASELIYNGLVEIDEKGNLVPELAESWSVSSGDYTFKLRKGVTWHDGRPFTSADVRYTFEEVLTKYHARAKASLDGSIFKIETPDPLTIIFRFYKPYAPFLQQLNVTEAPILPAHIYAGSDPTKNPANIKPIGTGPFKFESSKAGAEIRLTANKSYFKAGLPYLDGVVLRVIPDPGNQVIALEAGEVDFIYTVNGPDLARVKANKSISTIETLTNPGGTNCISSMSFNLDKPLFADQRMRQGILQSLDRQQFVDRILFGQGKVATAPISSGIKFAHAKDLKMPPFDRVAANALFNEIGWKRSGSATRVSDGVAGVKDGTPLRFRFIGQTSFSVYGQLVKAQLAEVGIDVQLESLEAGPFIDKVFVKRDFDTNVISYCNATDPEIGVRRMYDVNQIGPVGFSNSSAYRNVAVTKLFEDAATSSTLAARGVVYRKIQEILVEELPYIWLVETSGTRAFRSICAGFSESGHFAETASCKF